ncbi:hydroxyproline-rich glycoprotein family protein [Striga asiatica]|uniref:Hydroxyproline-rich glycoprotein family protein n=1 Tax=Striga asiatica TaxID=4170 RepID=A0A5A7QKJ5_STRAF|nr:hydroxyproline-rich glycoprotein family protein [Striga asiatica]
MNFGFFKMWMKNRQDIPIRPVLLKFGVAFVISIGGIVFTLFRSRIIRPPQSKPSHPSPGTNSQTYSRVESGEFRDDRVFLDSPLKKIASNNSISDPSPALESSKSCSDHEHEIKHLQAHVKTLEEKEKNLQNQLLGKNGLKDHENAIVELKNQLRQNNIEAKHYNLKIESLISSNKKLEARLVDYENVVTELEGARGKVKALRNKLKSAAEQNQEQIVVLQDRVMRLKDKEKKTDEINQEMEAVVREREELRRELEEMKKSNQSLRLENSDLAQKLGYVQMLATTALDNEEVLELREERKRLRKQNESVKEEMKQLQANHRSDMEELVHLRWVNACLRQQLRNPDKPLHSSTSDLESSSQASCLTDESAPETNKTEGLSKQKVFEKLKKLLRRGGKGQNGKKTKLERAASVDDIAGKLESEFLQLEGGSESSSVTSRRSFDMPRLGSRGRKGPVGPWESSNCSSRTMGSLTEEEEDEYWLPGGPQVQEDVKNKLLKYAETLNRAHSKKFPKQAAGFG